MLPDDPGPDAKDVHPEEAPAPRPSSLVMLRGEGRVMVTRRGRTKISCRLTGVIETVHVEWLIAELDRQLATGVTEVFVDASCSTALSTPARRVLGEWSLARHPGLRAVHVLGSVGSLDEPLESLARMLGDRLHHHRQPEPFLVALQAHPA